MINYSNIPSPAVPNDNETVRRFDNHFNDYIELEPTVFAAMKGYFTNRGFDEAASESITITVMTQAYNDGYNPMQILDTLRGLTSIELSGLVSEILNYNRYKSSSLGFAQKFTPNIEIQRSIIA